MMEKEREGARQRQSQENVGENESEKRERGREEQRERGWEKGAIVFICFSSRLGTFDFVSHTTYKWPWRCRKSLSQAAV